MLLKFWTLFSLTFKISFTNFEMSTFNVLSSERRQSCVHLLWFCINIFVGLLSWSTISSSWSTYWDVVSIILLFEFNPICWTSRNTLPEIIFKSYWIVSEIYILVVSQFKVTWVTLPWERFNFAGGFGMFANKISRSILELWHILT